MTTDDDNLSQSTTQLVANGPRALILQYADAADSDVQALEFLAELSEAIDVRLCEALALSE
ncbi:hypothetical protein ACVBEH_14005 [Roseateles sp. GG27B]